MDRAQASLVTPKRPDRVPESLDKRLLAYALAAGAGLAAAPELAQATIVYSNPADTTISSNGQFIDIDLNNDTIIFDARVSTFSFSDDDDGYSFAEASVRVGGNGQLTGVIGNFSDAAALAAGDPISPLQSFQDIQFSTRLMASSYAYADGESFTDIYGPFANVGDRYLGLTFQIDGAAHFGWARFGVTASAFAEGGSTFATASATLRAYAFEDCPREGILAGATQGGASCPSGVPMPPALALVALGAGGLALWRARRRDGQ